MDPHLPLPALLSQVLTAFIIEFDNEFEHRMPHRTANHGATGSHNAPWLVSMAMWTNCMRFITEQGVSVRELERLGRTTSNLNGMERWGYVTIAPDPANPKARTSKKDWLIRATPAGRQAQKIWRPLEDVIAKRWQQRFGGERMARIEASLWKLARQFALELPDCLPIVQYGLFSKLDAHEDRSDGDAQPARSASLPALLSKALLGFALEFERSSEISLAICSNVLRLMNAKGVRLRDLPRQSGVAKEMIAASLSFLKAKGCAALTSPATKGASKVVRLMAKGEKARAEYLRLLAAIEDEWQQRFGKALIAGLRASLEELLDENALRAELWRGIEPYPEGWRAAVAERAVLPHFPVVSHRGGFPDGS